jgi:hypothetical protein
VQTDGEVLVNSPDMTVTNKEDRTCLLIDVANPSDRNAIERRLSRN